MFITIQGSLGFQASSDIPDTVEAFLALAGVQLLGSERGVASTAGVSASDHLDGNPLAVDGQITTGNIKLGELHEVTL